MVSDLIWYINHVRLPGIVVTEENGWLSVEDQGNLIFDNVANTGGLEVYNAVKFAQLYRWDLKRTDIEMFTALPTDVYIHEDQTTETTVIQGWQVGDTWPTCFEVCILTKEGNSIEFLHSFPGTPTGKKNAEALALMLNNILRS